MEANAQKKLKRATQHWVKATPIRQKDGIISSDFILNREAGFAPSYEKDRTECINMLMTEEYMRIWFKERALYEKMVYTKKEIQREQAHIYRRFVQRDCRKRVVRNSLPIIELKRFQNIPCKTDHGQSKLKNTNAVTDEGIP